MFQCRLSVFEVRHFETHLKTVIPVRGVKVSVALALLDVVAASGAHARGRSAFPQGRVHPIFVGGARCRARGRVVQVRLVRGRRVRQVVRPVVVGERRDLVRRRILLRTSSGRAGVAGGRVCRRLIGIVVDDRDCIALAPKVGVAAV